MTAIIVNFGSINIDHVYQVPHFVKAGETLSSHSLATGLGGKGANQSAAIAKAGGRVAHIGRVSASDRWAVDMLASVGVETQYIEFVDGASGHAIIQVDASGENCIVLHGGANQSFEQPQLATLLDSLGDIEYLLMQNECNCLADVLEIAHARGFKTVLNPAPMTDAIKTLPLHKLDTLIVNQGEAEALCDGVSDVNEMVAVLTKLAPESRIVITLGSDGALLAHGGKVIKAQAPTVSVVDTTAAGDTFVGYFLAGLAEGMNEENALVRACGVASITATREGAISSIPDLEEVNSRL